MKYDLSKFEELVEQGYLRKVVKEDLVLFGYTDKCTYDKYWNEYTRAARGLILNKMTGEVVAKPFPKFFNLNEMPETSLVNLPINDGYESFEKLDGSLGIVYHHNGKWNVATRGSFNSDQAIRGQELLQLYDLSLVDENTTLLVEIIYPENKIVIDYKGESKLVLLAAYNRNSEAVFWELDLLSKVTDITLVKKYDLTIEQMIELKKILPKDDEGFVVRFQNGLRVKIKGDEYLRIAKLISEMSPLSFWECMENGKVKSEYLMQLPEEYRSEYEELVTVLENQYSQVLNEVVKEFTDFGCLEDSPEARKKIGLEFKGKHKSPMFALLQDKRDKLDNYVMKYIRPDGNNFRVLD